MLLELADLLQRLDQRLPPVPVPHVPHDHEHADRARGVAAGRTGADPQAGRGQGRPGDPQRRSAVAPGQGRHADDGRRADPRLDRGIDPAVGGPAQPLRLGRARRHGRVRRDRLLRRLQEAGDARQPRPAGALEVFLAVGVRARRRAVPVLHRRHAGRDHVLSPTDQARAGAARLRRRRGDRLAVAGRTRRHRVHRVDLLHRGRLLQCGEPDRWPRRSRDHAERAGFDRARRVRLPRRQQGVLRPTSTFRRFRVPANWRSSAARWPAPASASSGSTPIRRRCSWATSARSRSAPRSAPSR